MAVAFQDSLRLYVLRPPPVAALPAVHEGPKLLVGAPLKVGDVMVYDTQRHPSGEGKNQTQAQGGGGWMLLLRGKRFVFEDEFLGGGNSKIFYFHPENWERLQF